MVDTSLVEDARAEHLSFYIAGYSKRGNIPRPAFRFIPHIYYEDLVKAVERVEQEVANNKALKERLHIGWRIFERSYKETLGKYPNSEQDLIIKELKKTYVK